MSRNLSLSRIVALIVISAVFAQQAAAGPPDILRNYRFIPSRSNVHVSGGFASVNWNLQVDGTFGLATGFGSDVDSPIPVLRPFAKFLDVDATLFNPLSLSPIPAPEWDLDDTLNLSGLDGTFRLGHPNRFLFRGEDGQGQPITLHARIRGRLLRIVGATDPVNRDDGSVCSDCFQYKIHALAALDTGGLGSSVVPEPATLWLLPVGCAYFLLRRRK